VVSVLGLLLTVQTVLIGTGPAAASLSRALPRAAPAGAAPVRIEIDTVTPAALPPTGTLVVQGRITNAGTTPLNHVYLRLRYRYETLEKRADLQKWASGDEALTRSANEPRDANETGKYRKTLKAPLPAHGGASFRLAVPAAKLGLPDNAAAFGSRGLVVETFADLPGAGPEQVGAAYTFVVWDPKPVRQPTRLTVLAPVTSTLPQGDASDPSPGLMASMAQDGRLGRLATTIQRSGISWAIDPALLAAATRAQNQTDTPATKPGSTPTATPSVRPGVTTSQPGPASTGPRPTGPGSTGPGSTDTPATSGGAAPSPRMTGSPGAGGSPATMVAGAASHPDDDTTTPGTTTPGTTPPGQDGEATSGGASGVAASWLGGVRRMVATNRPLVLPFGDPDLGALAHNDGAGLLGLARTQADTTTKQVFGTSPRSSVAWPADGQADAATIDTLAGPSWQGVILVASSQPPTTAQVVTPSARSTVSRQGTPLAGLLCDEGLSALLAQLGKAGTGATEIALIQQRLLAELATITAERPAESRHLLAVAPRDWDPDPLAVERVLTVLRQAPWVQLQSVDALLAQRPSPVKRPDLHYPGQALAAELPKDVIDWVVHKEQALEAFAPVLTVPQLVVPELQRRMVSLTSVAWRGRSRAELVAARAPVQERLYAILGAVTVLPGSSVTMLSHSGNLPITVQNRLDQPVRVQLVLKPKSRLLVVGNRKPFAIGARGNHTAVVPFRAAGNGDVPVEASLWTVPKGAEPIHQAPRPLLVRVRSNWETTGLSIAAVVLGLLVLVGLVRSIRRGRRPLPPESAPDPEELLVRQESGRQLPAALRVVRRHSGSPGQGRTTGGAGPGSAPPGRTPPDRTPPEDQPNKDQAARRRP
jgi:hypothetical protein